MAQGSHMNALQYPSMRPDPPYLCRKHNCHVDLTPLVDFHTGELGFITHISLH